MTPLEHVVQRSTPSRPTTATRADDHHSSASIDDDYTLMGVGETVWSLVEYADWCLAKRGFNGGTYRDRKAFHRRENEKYRGLREEGYGRFSASALATVLPDIDEDHRSNCSELLGLVGVGALPESDVEDIAELADLDADTISRAHIYRGDPLSAVDNMGRAVLASGALEVTSMDPEMGTWYFGSVAALHGVETGVRTYFKRQDKHLPSIASWLSSPSAMAQGASVALSYPFRQRVSNEDLSDDIRMGKYSIGYVGDQ